ncbi:MAG: NAD(P)H-binding protein [Myxococcales bacterium]|nr:NAD(P)H-binding protein [Myxococcales bacterium]
MRIAILGMGYTGMSVAQQLISKGYEVVGIARRMAPLVVFRERLGERFLPIQGDTRNQATLKDALEGASRVIHLAPPPRDRPVDDDAVQVGLCLGKNCERLVYGSTTGVYSPPVDPDEWVDEDSPVVPGGRLGQMRAVYERELLNVSPAPTHIVRIAGIYGPGRHLITRLEAGKLELFEGGSRVSRIHRDDLARILVAMTIDASPPTKLIACDEEPTPTLDVVRYAASLTNLKLPTVHPSASVRSTETPSLKEFRTSGKPCRSLYREQLIGELHYPTYREGMDAALREDGYLSTK